jgi:hypothetical protein
MKILDTFAFSPLLSASLFLIRKFHWLAAADQNPFAGNQHLYFGSANFTNINLTYLIRHLRFLLFIRTQISADKRRKKFPIVKA